MAKKESRKAREARLRQEAASVTVPAACDVAVVGGGASGLAAAITAAEAGSSVVILERNLACGLPILVTGNGRCNFANVSLNPRHYNNPSFVEATCGSTWLDSILSFFRESGLRWCLEDDRLYPSSRQAASVRNVLLRRAQKAGVILASNREVLSLEELGGSVRLCYREASAEDAPVATLKARSLVLATGGAFTPLNQQLALPCSPQQHVLCPLACASSPLTELDGRRATVLAHLTKEGSFFPSWQERGEVLFRSYGLSGIVIFDASRRASSGDLIELDLAPDVNRSELQQLVDPFLHGSFEQGCLDGILDPTIAATLEQLARSLWHISWPEHRSPTTRSAALIDLVKALPFVVEGPAGGEQAQATRGGLATDSFEPTSLAARELPWLHACGEALDIDADCGGFNLAWAWKSGMVAGLDAAKVAQAC